VLVSASEVTTLRLRRYTNLFIIIIIIIIISIMVLCFFMGLVVWNKFDWLIDLFIYLLLQQ